MADARALFEDLCPPVAPHPALGKVMWMQRPAAFVAFRKMLGDTENVPVLIHPPVPAPRSMSAAEQGALLDRASERLSGLDTQTQALRASGFEAWRDKVAKEGDDRYRLRKPRPGLSLGSVHIYERESLVVWFFAETRIGEHADIWVEPGGRLRTSQSDGRSAAPRPVPDWALALPGRFHHPVLGDLAQTLDQIQYIAFRPMKEPPLVRIDLRPTDAAVLPALFDRCAALLARLESSFDESKARAVAMLESLRLERDLPPFRWESEWAVFLEDGPAALLLRDAMPNDSDDECYFNVSLSFDSTGSMTEVKATTEEETYSVLVPPPAPPRERVVHAKFGAGTIVEVIGEGKVRVRFGDGAERVMQRAFLASG